MPSSRYERAARSAGYRTIAGLDEAGRGALFGPVFAAAVVLDPARQIRGLDDSKQLEPERREVLAERIRERAAAWAVGAADAFEIDRLNILEASRLAMRRALERLGVHLHGTPSWRNIGAVESSLPGRISSCWSTWMITRGRTEPVNANRISGSEKWWAALLSMTEKSGTTALWTASWTDRPHANGP